jgi:hypothetical protein
MKQAIKPSMHTFEHAAELPILEGKYAIKLEEGKQAIMLNEGKQTIYFG